VKSKKYSPGSQVLISLAAFVVVMAGVIASASILTPILLSFFIAIILVQPILWLRSKGVNHTLAIIIVLISTIAIFGGIGMVIGTSINNFVSDAPIYANKLRELLNDLLTSLNTQGINISPDRWQGIIDPGKIMNYTASLLSDFGALMGNTMLIFFIVVFVLLERNSLRLKAEIIAENYNNNLNVLTTIINSIRTYLGLKTMISLVTGIFIWLWLLIFGVKYAMLWGLIAFLLNYIPNIGSIIAGIPTVLFALVQLGLGGAGWTILGYLIVNMVVGNVVEPRLMGRKMELSTLIVFLSLIFWGFILGTVGMFLAIPLTMTFKIMLDQNPKTQWLSILLGSDDHARDMANNRSKIDRD